MNESLLVPSDPPVFKIINERGSSSVVLVCDHASNCIPQRLNNLGLKPVELADHISWDPGAALVARRFSEILDAPLILSGYSRLVIDCNRAISRIDSIAEKSAGVVVKGNQGLSIEQQKMRVDELFNPYHQAIDEILDTRAKRQTLLLSIHSFTPCLNGVNRPWHICISSAKDRRLAMPMLKELSLYEELVVGDNEPYAIENNFDYTLPKHGDARGLLYVMVEIRQDLLAEKGQPEKWAEKLAKVYLSIEEEVLCGLSGS